MYDSDNKGLEQRENLLLLDTRMLESLAVRILECYNVSYYKFKEKRKVHPFHLFLGNA